MQTNFRNLQVYADGNAIAAGCRLRLSGSESLSLHPGFFQLTVRNLSSTSASLLAEAKRLEVRSGATILASGEITDAHTHFNQGNQLTEIAFASGLSLWESAVSLYLPADTTVSETVKELLAASGAGVPLTAFTGTDHTFSRPQAFFGRTVTALGHLAAAAEADAWLSPAGLVFSGKADRKVAVILTEKDLLSAPTAAEGCVILTTSMTGWPAGAFLRYTYKGITGEGRILKRTIEADNTEGPWRSVLVIQNAR